MDALHVRIAATEISDNGGRGASFEIPTGALGTPTDVKLDLCGGPQPGQTAAGGTGSISSGGGLSAKPSCGLRGASPGP
jgi:hypothetical protein